jgi:hypothetical protein
VKKGFVSYVGQMVYTGHQLIQAPDKKAAHRKAIVLPHTSHVSVQVTAM